jgi:hypothetical protein
MISNKTLPLAFGAALIILPLVGSQATKPSPDLDQQIGQMLMVGFRGLSLAPDNPIVSDIRDRKIGSQLATAGQHSVAYRHRSGGWPS